MPAKKTSAIESVAGTIKPPISFKEFSKDPVKGMLFIVLIAIGYLYVDIKMSNKEMIARQDLKIERYEIKVDTLQNQVMELISLSATEKAKNDVLSSLNQLAN
jgi:hypothetical protein